MQSFTKELVSIPSVQLLPDNTLNSFTNFFTGGTESGWSMGGCLFGNIPTINLPKCYGRKVHVFWQQTFQVFRYSLPGIWSSPFHYGYCWSHEQSHARNSQSQRMLYLSWSNSMDSNFWDLPCKWRIQSCFSLVRTWDTFLKVLLAMNLEFGKGPHRLDFADDLVRIYPFMIYKGLIKYNTVGDKALLMRCFPILSNFKAGDNINTER